jgi:hypothetical protein
MTGSVFYPLGQRIRDTADVHGIYWTATYYASHGVPMREFILLAKGAGAL